MNKATLLSFALATACGAAAAQTKPAAMGAPAVGMKPGLWEMTHLIETQGSVVKRTVTAQNCYTAEDVSDVARVLPPQRDFGMKCVNRDIKNQVAATSWRVTCTSKDLALDGPATVSFSGDTYVAHAHLISKSGGRSLKVEQTINGKLIGECK